MLSAMSEPDPAEPQLAQRGPYVVELPPGEYLWCACGRSKNQPFCDESHAGTPFRPIRFTVPPKRNPQTFWMCGCKRSRHKPFCDGTHNKV